MPIYYNRLTDAYGWNERAGRYINLTSGRFVSFPLVKSELEAVIMASQGNMRDLTARLQTGQISLAEWQLKMASEMRVLHTASAAAARGGWAQMSQADWGAVGALVKKQYRYLAKFARDIQTGVQPMDGRLTVRADLYAKAARATYEEMRRRYARQHGVLFERRILGEADHCNGCLEQAAMRWQPVGTLDPIGAEECSTNCQCEFDYADYQRALALGLIQPTE